MRSTAVKKEPESGQVKRKPGPGRPKLTQEEREKRKQEYAENPDMYKKKKWSMGKPESLQGGGITSIDRYCNATNEEVSQLMENVVKWYELGKMSPVKTDEECAERLSAFFQYLIKTGEKPSVEKMALALGVTRRTLEYWKNGELGSKMRQAMICYAYETLAAMDAELVNNNKIPQVVYIFRSKNFFGMKDQSEIVHHTNTRKEIDEDELRKRILQNVIIEEAQDAEFTEISPEE